MTIPIVSIIKTIFTHLSYLFTPVKSLLVIAFNRLMSYYKNLLNLIMKFTLLFTENAILSKFITLTIL